MSFLPTLLVMAAVGQTPDAAGPHMVTVSNNVSIAAAGRMVDVAIYAPSDRAGAPYPVVIIGHGFARTRDNVAGHAQHLASWGMVVVTPDFPSRFSPDHALNGRIMVDLLAWARGGSAPIAGLPDPRRAAYVGHSAGGLSAFLAAASDPTVTALVGLDPVDNAAAGVGAAPRITAPTLVLGAVADRCNSSGSASALYAALAVSQRWYLRVTGATHCDGEDPSNALCTATCGGEDPARRLLFRRYMTAHLRAAFACEARDWLPGGAALTADVTSGVVAELDAPGTYGCAATPDGGLAPDAAGPADASADGGADAGAVAPPEDAAAPEDATAATEDATAAPEDAAASGADATDPTDATSAADAGVRPDASTPLNPIEPDGCTTTSPSHLGLYACAVLLALVRRRRHR